MSKDDLVERLRIYPDALCDEAADEIERLRRKVDAFARAIGTADKIAVEGQYIANPKVCDCEPEPLGCNFPFCKVDASPPP